MQPGWARATDCTGERCWLAAHTWAVLGSSWRQPHTSGAETAALAECCYRPWPQQLQLPEPSASKQTCSTAASFPQGLTDHRRRLCWASTSCPAELHTLSAFTNSSTAVPRDRAGNAQPLTQHNHGWLQPAAGGEQKEAALGQTWCSTANNPRAGPPRRAESTKAMSSLGD